MILDHIHGWRGHFMILSEPNMNFIDNLNWDNPKIWFCNPTWSHHFLARVCRSEGSHLRSWWWFRQRRSSLLKQGWEFYIGFFSSNLTFVFLNCSRRLRWIHQLIFLFLIIPNINHWVYAKEQWRFWCQSKFSITTFPWHARAVATTLSRNGMHTWMEIL